MPEADDELARLQQILQENSKLNFVQRILQPELYPHLDNGDGTVSTHLMADAEVEGTPIVFPTIIHDLRTDTLKRLSMDEALQHAIKTNQYIEFKTPEEANWFAQNFKKVWKA